MIRSAHRWLAAVFGLALFAIFLYIGSEPVLFAGDTATTPCMRIRSHARDHPADMPGRFTC